MLSKIRKEFESWAKHHIRRLHLEHDDENTGYFDDVTQAAWMAWQEAWTRANKIAVKRGRCQVIFGRKRR